MRSKLRYERHHLALRIQLCSHASDVSTACCSKDPSIMTYLDVNEVATAFWVDSSCETALIRWIIAACASVYIEMRKLGHGPDGGRETPEAIRNIDEGEALDGEGTKGVACR